MENETKQDENKMKWKPIISFYVKTTGWIALPLLFALFTGQYVKKSFGSQSLFFVFIMIGFGITCFGVYQEIKNYKKSLEKDDK